MPPHKHFQSLKHLHSFFFAPKQAFTLVELIIVISVLGVLATIAFTQISNVTQSARNSTRMTNIQSISSSLDIYKATNGTYPIPDNKTDILYSGTTIGYQGYIKDTAARLLKLSPTASQDPLNTSSYFSYATNNARTNMQLLGFLEANTTSFKVLPATFASDELGTKTPYSKGEELGMLYTSGTTTPLAGTSIELNTLTNPYTAYYNSTDSLSGTGNLLQNLVISYAHGSGFGSPSTDDCPTGFIPVPGNKDFNQPGFCVMKYEAKVAGGVAGPSAQGITWNNHDYITGEIPVSTAQDIPIATIMQYKASAACQLLGPGYHVLTNNEYMTIARNIELVGSNWSSGVVGSGFVYSGHNDNSPAQALIASRDDGDGYFNTGDGQSTPGDGAYNNYSSNIEQAYKGQRRTLTLSNGQVIWDLAGNVWEHVNKANNLSGENQSSTTIWLANVCNAIGNRSFYGDDGTAQCAYQNGYTYENIGPKTPFLNALNGIGRIYSASRADNVFVRGGSWVQGAFAGIYTIDMTIGGTTPSNGVGFRCAK